MHAIRVVPRGLTVLALATALISCSDGAIEPDINEPDRVLYLQGTPSQSTELMVVDADGGNPRRLLPQYKWFDTPQLMPDGESVMMVASDLYCGFLVRMPLDGGPTAELLSTSDHCVHSMRVSPSGQHVAFKADVHSPTGRRVAVFVMRLNGTELTEISDDLPPAGGSCRDTGEPQTRIDLRGWVSHTRVQLYRYVCRVGGATFSVGMDGRNATQESAAMLSPDATRLLSGGAELAVLDVFSGARNVIGSDAILVDRGRDDFTSPWSADGSHIFWQHSVSGAHYISRADGSASQEVTRYPVTSATSMPVFWGFAGANDRVLYSDWDAEAQSLTLYKLTNDGSDPVPLSAGTGYARSAIWLPAR